MGFLDKQMRRGFLFGIGIPVFLVGILLLIFDVQNRNLDTEALLGVVTLSALPNLLLFFYALRKNNDALANGVLMSTILWALFTFGIKLLA